MYARVCTCLTSWHETLYILMKYETSHICQILHVKSSGEADFLFECKNQKSMTLVKRSINIFTIAQILARSLANFIVNKPTDT